ncbi:MULTISPECIES: hypothetical protein, partial [Cobetia]|uniref:hypothetical protein n=1 Tax=Cobetia TaxID=204286 RepID=UPI001C70DF81
MFALLFIPSLVSAKSLFQDPNRDDLNSLLNLYEEKDLAVGFRLIDYSLGKQLRSFGLPLLHCC